MSELEGDLVVVHDNDALGVSIHRTKLANRPAKRQPAALVWGAWDPHYATVSLPVRLADHLAARARTHLDASSSTPCGVLLALLPVGSAFEVLYTLRSQDLPNHKGQVAFPGGKHSPDDESLLVTALREADEEVGIRPEHVRILGSLDDVYTMATDFVITPYVGLLPEGYRFEANPAEVSEVFTVPVDDLRNPDYHAVTDREWRGATFPVDVITAGPHVIWGATHSITTNLIECLVDLSCG